VVTTGTVLQRRRAASALLWVLMVAAATYVVSIYARPHPGHSTWWDDWFYDATLWSAALVCLWGARRGPRRGAGSTALAISLLLYAVGNTWWSVWVAPSPDPPYPSVADYLWLSFYPLALVAIWLLADGRGGRGRLQVVDGLIGALAVAAVGMLVSVGPIAHSVTGSPAAVLVNLAYPVGDLGLLVLLISLSASSGRRPPVAWVLLGISMVTWAVADSTYVFQVAAGTYQQGSLLDAGWLVPITLLAWVPWTDTTTSRAAGTDHAAVDTGDSADGGDGGDAAGRPVSTLAIPAVLAAICVALLARQVWDEAPWFAVLAGAALTAAGARLVLSVREVERLVSARIEARTDELTGLGNRRAFLEALKAHLATGGRFHLLLMDLDGFKNVNDTLGHSAGDICLQTIAARMSALCGTRRALYRLGGDEFALLTTASQGEVSTLAGQLQVTVARPVPIGDQQVRVATSIGIIACPDQATTSAQALRRADTAMYHAKTHRLGHIRYTSDHPVPVEPLETPAEIGLQGATDGNDRAASGRPVLEQEAPMTSSTRADHRTGDRDGASQDPPFTPVTSSR
jgi:diguanylate cyclase